METTQREGARRIADAEDQFDYECHVSGIRITLGFDCVPRGLHVPPPLFGRRADQLARTLVTAFAEASAACQHHASALPAAGVDTDEDVEGEVSPGSEDEDSLGAFTDTPAGLDVDDCLARLHSVANCLTSAHHDLLTSTSKGSDPANLVHASANSSGAITALTLSPLLASEGTTAAESAIVSAAAEAISAANDSRASVIEDALGAVLVNSLTRKWN